VFARPDGAVLDLPDSRAAVDGGAIAPASAAEFIPLPAGSLLLTLPGRTPLAFDRDEPIAFEKFEGIEADAVAAALPLGYTRTLLPAFQTRPGSAPLPLYGYAAVGWRGGGFCVAAMRTDHLEAWSARSHSAAALRKGIGARRLELPDGPLLRQLERCALEYGCYTAQNAFLRQGEAAIPVSPACNARCIGCISEQEPDAGVASAQARIRSLASVAEMTELAVAHLESARNAMISFGQGCEGEPLLAAPHIAAAIQAIRKRTSRGVIHINTNASLPRAIEALIDAGLQSVRVSLNSARPDTYAAYYRPRGYDFAAVAASIKQASDRGVALSLNLLTHPGVTDEPQEMEAFGALLRHNRVTMVQTRALNVDPALYFAAVGRPHRAAGMRRWFAWMRREFPSIALGNFTRGFG
jgi:wyosine [tRNA(Phe)-imidazoG37] synthetase (radical SAM superfamily)